MKILHVLPSLKADGGVERMVLECSEALLKRRQEILIAAADGVLRGALERAGARVFSLPLHRRGPLSIAANFLRLRRLIKREKPHLIHAHSRAPAWSAYWAARLTKTHFITNFHGLHGAGFALKRLYNSVMAKGEAVVVNSRFMRKYVRDTYKPPRSRLELIPQSLDLRKFRPQSIGSRKRLRRRLGFAESDKIVLMPSRLSGWKGHHLAAEAMAGLDAAIVFMGGGRQSILNKLKKQAKALGLQARFIKPRRDIEKFMAAADVVLSAATAKPEAFGRAALESQAVGTVPVAPAFGGSPELITDGKTGFLFRPGDSNSCRRALNKALKNCGSAQMKKRMLANGAGYDHRKIGDAYLRLYYKIWRGSLA